MNNKVMKYKLRRIKRLLDRRTDADTEFITLHPNGPGTKGQVVPIDSSSGQVKTKWGEQEGVVLNNAQSQPVQELRAKTQGNPPKKKMTPHLPEEYYRLRWEDWLNSSPAHDEYYLNLEQELEKEMGAYKGANIPEDALNVVRKMHATNIAKKAYKKILEERDVVKRVEREKAETGKPNMGYTTEDADRRAYGALIGRFEFNCLQLRDFREKYGIQDIR